MKIFLLFLSALFLNANCAKILGVFPYPSKSHSILGKALFVELADRGHDVTFISPYPFKKPPRENFRDLAITSKDLLQTFDQEIDDSFEATEVSIFFMMKFWIEGVAKMQEYTMEDPAVQKLLKSGEKYDLCVIEFLMNESLLGFGAQFDCNFILKRIIKIFS